MTSAVRDAAGAGGWALAALAGALAVAAPLATGSAAAIAGTIAALLAGVALVAVRRWTPVLLAAVFALAPIDVSKAVIAPVASVFYAAGPYYSPGLYLTLAQMALLLLLVAWLGRRVLVEGRGLPFTRLDAAAFAYLGWIWLRSLGTPQGALSIGTAMSYSLAVLGFWVVSHAVETRAHVRIGVVASLVAFAATLVDVAAQAITRSPLTLPGGKSLAAGAVVSLGASGEAFRPPGFMNHPNALAHYLVVMLPPAIALLLVGRRRLPGGAWAAALAVVLGGSAALLVTLSRGGWAAAALAAAVTVGCCLRRGVLGPRGLGVLVAGGVVAFGGVLVAYPSVLLRLTAPDGRSLESRGLLADMAWTIIRTHPWIGVGFGDFNRVAFQTAAPLYANVSEDYQLALHQLIVHDHYLLIGAELGLPAMAFFAWLLWRFARLAAPLARWRDPVSFALATGLAAGLAGQALFLASDNYYADIRIFMLWLGAGLLQALSLQNRRAARRARAATP